MMTQGQTIEALRIAYLLGLVTADDIVGWADRIIGRGVVADDRVYDLSLCARKSPVEVSDLMTSRGEQGLGAVAMQAVLGMVYRRQQVRAFGLGEIRALSSLLGCGIDPMLSEADRFPFLNIVWGIDDLDVYGSEADIRQEFEGVLDRFAAHADDLPVG